MDVSIIGSLIGTGVLISVSLVGAFWKVNANNAKLQQDMTNKLDEKLKPVHENFGVLTQAINDTKQGITEARGEIKLVGEQVSGFKKLCQERHKDVDRRINHVEKVANGTKRS